MMRKRVLLVSLFSAMMLLCVACGKGTKEPTQSQGGVSVESVESTESEGGAGETESEGEETFCEHQLTKLRALAPSCVYAGNIECWVCNTCKSYFLDEAGETKISREETKLEKLPHEATYYEPLAATCAQDGHIEHYSCDMCKKYYEDEACTIVLDKETVFLPALPHTLQHKEARYGKGNETGLAEHWHCDDCDGYYMDEAGDTKVAKSELVLAAPYSIPDFIVEVPANKTPVILQLSDTQIVDAGQTRDDTPIAVWYDRWATDQMEERCFDYLTETINATKPDFIFITGDIVYGAFDDNGSVLRRFVEFMDSFQIPWSPVFGNHDNESKMGVDWQCEQFENSKYCKFEQNTVTGNGNYSVGIAQDGVITRIFYLMDTNGCDKASAESFANKQTTAQIGFGQDQIDWYTNQITELKVASPDTKISFAFHIQPTIFVEAYYKKYGVNHGVSEANINIDWSDKKEEGDFGYIGRRMKEPWDGNNKVYKGMKALGVDSIFVGHEHANSGSIVYDGIRFQFGQKSSEYCRFNSISSSGKITTQEYIPSGSVAMVGGSVMSLAEDGTIINPYIYLCGEKADAYNQKPKAKLVAILQRKFYE